MKKLLLISYLLGIAGLLSFISLVIYLRSIDQISERINFSQEKHDMLQSSNDMLENLREAESAQRAYLLTQNFRYLSDYEAAVFRIENEKDRLIKILKNNDEDFTKGKAIRHLEYLISLKLLKFKETLILSYQKKYQQAVLSLEGDSNKDMLNEIEKNFHSINYTHKYMEIKNMQFLEKFQTEIKYLLLFLGIITFTVMIVTFHKLRNLIEEQKEKLGLNKKEAAQKELYIQYSLPI